jgi:hypothetical protein
LTPPKRLTLEAITYIQGGELVELTPKHERENASRAKAAEGFCYGEIGPSTDGLFLAREGGMQT